MARFALIAALLSLFALAAPVVNASGTVLAVSGEPMILPVDPAPLVAETAAGSRTFTIEVADTDAERSAGLMYRTEMGEEHGMLFVFEQTRRVAFWMKNTPLPLDLVFVGQDGRVAAIMQGEPQSTAVLSPDAPVRFVLELNAGTAQKAGIAAGDVLRHPRIDSISGDG